MAQMGAGGMRAIAEVSAQRAHALADRLGALPGFSVAFDTPYLWEFTLRVPGDAARLADAMRERGILAGLPLGGVDPALSDALLVCCTEMTSPAAIDHYVDAARELAERLQEVRA
jgi:glycine dehydrogenase subunit 1